ncbi:HAAS signaling domain-containing protein [Bacillus alkalicellulosilyticus]|uniref:HAAS signaling domain-containing protein n=1 Tax=Alkalihalobacterium alkalicellulosilyticum TaxID=1912214 RepID=UPI0009964743|nr:permease prefix domain 1-containing protein [Bacillus alkalicellulosilyticus]
MIQSKADYLQALEKELGRVTDRKELLRELELHITEMVDDLFRHDGLEEKEAMRTVIERFGVPKQVALSYQDELKLTPTKVKWTFITVNVIFFLGGICLTLLYNYNLVPVVSQVWIVLTSITAVLILLYMFFWVFLGYEIGKEFGLTGKRLLRKTFTIALVPNLLLMGLVVFRIMPHGWFDPLLSPSFIVTCIVCTIVLYPCCYAGFRWGTFRSI